MTTEERNKLEREIEVLEITQERRRDAFKKFHGLQDLVKAYNDLCLGVQRPEIFMHPDDLESYVKWLEEKQGEAYAGLPYFKGVQIQSDVSYFLPPKGKVYLRCGCICRDVDISFDI